MHRMEKQNRAERRKNKFGRGRAAEHGGWPMVLSGLKTLLETGELLTTPGSLRFLRPQPGA